MAFDLSALLHELSAIEWFAVVATLLNVWLVMRADTRNFPIGIVSVIAYAYVFWSAKLYANFALQLIYYLPMQVIGWWVWLRTGPKKDDDLPIKTLTLSQNGLWIIVTAIGTGIAGYLLSFTTDGHIPYVDAFTTALSVIGQYMLTRKWMENWFYWIVADIIYVFWLFPSQKLFVSTGLYTVLLIMAVNGLLKWRKASLVGECRA